MLDFAVYVASAVSVPFVLFPVAFPFYVASMRLLAVSCSCAISAGRKGITWWSGAVPVSVRRGEACEEYR